MPVLNTSLDSYEVWFLTGSQNLYGEETLRQVAEQSKTIADALNASSDVPVTVVWKPVLKDAESIRRAALDANADDRVIGLIAWMHTFSPAKMWIGGLDALRKPLLHLHTQANVELPWAAWLRFMKSMSIVDQGSSMPACVCRCSSGFCSASSPAIHIFAGENVCIQVITPTHSGALLASSICRWIAAASSSTGFQTTVTGMSLEPARMRTTSCDCSATWRRVSSP